MQYSATSILFIFIMLSMLLTVPVKLSTKIISAQKDSLGSCFLAVVFSLCSQVIITFVAPNIMILIGASILVNGGIFSEQLGVPFLRGLMIAILSVAITWPVASYFGLIEFGVTF